MALRVCIPEYITSWTVSNAEFPVYKTESELGQGIKESGVDRSKLFVTTKVDKGNINDIAGALKTSLKKLQLDYVDLLVLSAPSRTIGINKTQVPDPSTLLLRVGE